MTSFSLSLIYMHTNSPTNYLNIPYIHGTAELTVLSHSQPSGPKTKTHTGGTTRQIHSSYILNNTATDRAVF